MASPTKWQRLINSNDNFFALALELLFTKYVYWLLTLTTPKPIKLQQMVVLYFDGLCTV